MTTAPRPTESERRQLTIWSARGAARALLERRPGTRVLDACLPPILAATLSSAGAGAGNAVAVAERPRLDDPLQAAHLALALATAARSDADVDLGIGCLLHRGDRLVVGIDDGPGASRQWREIPFPTDDPVLASAAAFSWLNAALSAQHPHGLVHLDEL